MDWSIALWSKWRCFCWIYWVVNWVAVVVGGLSLCQEEAVLMVGYSVFSTI